MSYNKLEYKKFRVRTPIKSFRDLDVYKNATQLSADIFRLKLPEKYRKSEKLKNELNILYDLAKAVPRLVAESYSEKFTSLASASAKLEKSAEVINLAISKIDFLAIVIDDAAMRGVFLDFIKKYQTNKRKILNLKRAWNRVWGDQKLRGKSRSPLGSFASK